SAKSATSVSDVDINDVTLTLKELKELLPQYAIKRLINHYKEQNKQKTNVPCDRDLMKLQDAISTIAHFTQNPSHPAVEKVEPTDPDFLCLCKAFNMIHSNAVPQPFTDSSTTTFTDTTTNTRSVTGNPITTEQSITGISTPFTGAAEQFALVD
ncbi:unnamed protein product, partial [Strongylus vulgaris]